MSIQVKFWPTKHPHIAGDFYTLKSKRRGTYTFDMLADDISHHCSLTRADVAGCMEAVMRFLLNMGLLFRLDYSISCHCNGGNRPMNEQEGIKGRGQEKWRFSWRSESFFALLQWNLFNMFFTKGKMFMKKQDLSCPMAVCLMALCLCCSQLHAGDLIVGNHYTIGLANGMTLFTENAGNAVNTPIVLWTDTEVPAQTWTYEADPDKGATFVNCYAGRCLASAGSKREGTSVLLRNRTTAASWWGIVPVEGKEDTYSLCVYSAADTFLLAAKSLEEGAKLQYVKKSNAEPSLSQWVIRDAAVMADAFDESVRDAMINGFAAKYYRRSGANYVLAKGGWWGDAEMFETILDAYETTGDTRYKTMFDNLYKNFVSRHGSDWSNNEYNDDITWMVLACIRAYKYFGNVTYKNVARSNYDRMYKRAQCYPEGMLRWKEGNNGTNSCINCPATIAACYLFEMTGDSTYLDKALSIYAGQRKNLFVTSSGCVYDSGEWKENGKFQVNNKWCSTYNQGTMLGAALMLLQHTGDTKYRSDANYIWKYSYNNLTESTNHIIHVCQTVNGDLCGFKGIFMRYARHYAEDMGKDDVQAWIAKNAWHAFQNRNSKGVTWSKWLTKTAENFKDGDADINDDAFGASTAVSAAANAHINAMFHKDAFSTIPLEKFDDICFFMLTNDEEQGTVTTAATREGAYVGWKNVDFGSAGADMAAVRVNAQNDKTTFALAVDGWGSNHTVALSDTLQQGWNTVLVPMPLLTGTHAIYVVMQTGGKMSLGDIIFGTQTIVRPLAPTDQPAATGIAYDLGGRVADISSPGIRIVDGKKVMIR